MIESNAIESDNSKLQRLIELDKGSLPADGGDNFNRLIFARSPYLLQHAENPWSGSRLKIGKWPPY
ncbi:MAG: hypothetical protein ABSG48_03085 [Geobacteraceae bacterium]